MDVFSGVCSRALTAIVGDGAGEPRILSVSSRDLEFENCMVVPFTAVRLYHLQVD